MKLKIGRIVISKRAVARPEQSEGALERNNRAALRFELCEQLFPFMLARLRSEMSLNQNPTTRVLAAHQYEEKRTRSDQRFMTSEPSTKTGRYPVKVTLAVKFLNRGQIRQVQRARLPVAFLATVLLKGGVNFHKRQSTGWLFPSNHFRTRNPGLSDAEGW